MDLKDNIREFRIQMNMSQADLGRALGISAQAVSKWETGKSEPDQSTIRRMCEVFDTTPDKLYGYSQQLREAAEGAVDFDRAIAQRKEQAPKAYTPVTSEARILAKGVDRMPEADRKRLLKMVDLMFEQYAEFFEKGTDAHDP